MNTGAVVITQQYQSIEGLCVNHVNAKKYVGEQGSWKVKKNVGCHQIWQQSNGNMAKYGNIALCVPKFSAIRIRFKKIK